MLVPLVLVLVTVPPASAAGSAGGDSVPPRVVRRFEAIEVSARLHGLRTTETAQVLSGEMLRQLPVDDLARAVALQAGVVAVGEDLHVRGGRSGETAVLLSGIPLNEPWRGSPPEIPPFAVREAELLTGGLDARYGGALAGVLNVRTTEPAVRWSGEGLYAGDGRRDTHYDRTTLLLRGPLFAGLGLALSGDARLEDTALPALRTERRDRLGPWSFGWRGDNHLLGFAKLAPSRAPQRFALELLAERRLEQPFDPMWSLDGWVTPCHEPDCRDWLPPQFSATAQPGLERYRAADHLDMTDERRLAVVASTALARGNDRLRLAVGWTHFRRLVSLGARDDPSYISWATLPWFARENLAGSDHFHVFGGNDPLFRRVTADALALRVDLERANARGDGIGVGGGLDAQRVRLYELDGMAFGWQVDSLREWQATAPGGNLYAQGRWSWEGLVLDGGLRLEYWRAGHREGDTGPDPKGSWCVSPRFGLVYPISDRDAFSFAYARYPQAPARDFLFDNRTRITARQPLGNSELAPATVISYQAAVKHLLGAAAWLQCAAFYRDLWGEVGVRNVPGLPGYPDQRRYASDDEGHAIGAELTLGTRRHAGQAALHYTWMHAWGYGSSPDGPSFGPPVGDRPEPVGEHPLDWDQTHTLGLTFAAAHGPWRLAWATTLASGRPWTPRAPRDVAADLFDTNARRLGWSERTDASLLVAPRLLRGLGIGLEVRNLFDFRGDLAAAVNGYPNPIVNTTYGDYEAYRTSTGLGGGGYLDDMNRDGVPEWVPVHDPRLAAAARQVRMAVRGRW